MKVPAALACTLVLILAGCGAGVDTTAAKAKCVQFFQDEWAASGGELDAGAAEYAEKASAYCEEKAAADPQLFVETWN